MAWPRLPAPLKLYALLNDAPGKANAVLPRLHCLSGASEIAVEGWLGAFRVTARLAEGRCAVQERLLGEDGVFDLILDLSSNPLLSLPVPPPGYYAPGLDEGRLAAALAELPDMVGVFDKPKFFAYDVRLCAHDTGAVQGCRACLEVCGAQAIAAEDGEIRVTPFLCQGCGDCAAACPSGALRYAWPNPAESLQNLRRMLQDFSRTTPDAPWLLLLPGEEGENWRVEQAANLPEHALPFPLEALGAAGLEFWLAALAFGAAGVALLDLPSVSDLTRANLRRQLAYGQALLDALGLTGHGARAAPDHESTHAMTGFPHPAPLPEGEGEQGIRYATFTFDGERLAFSTAPVFPKQGPLCPPATFACLDDKREILHLALEHLRRHAPLQPEETALPEGAPCGAIRVNADQCTLCLACVTLCPTSALRDGGEEPSLSLIEANCVQCGRCAHGCPENAIELQPRYLFDRNQARAPRLLHREAIFHCPECGKPFATERMIRAISERLKNHPMFQGGKFMPGNPGPAPFGRSACQSAPGGLVRRLSLCEECRIKAAFFDAAEWR